MLEVRGVSSVERHSLSNQCWVKHLKIHTNKTGYLHNASVPSFFCTLVVTNEAVGSFT